MCLLVPEMQNRRIVDAAFAEVGSRITPAVETDSMVALLGQVRAGGLHAVAPNGLLTQLGMDDLLLALPLERPVVAHEVGLVVADREPLPPLVAELWATAETLRA